MGTEITELSEDELFAFREFQESHYRTSDTDASDSDDSGRDGVTTDDSIAEEDGAGNSATEYLALISSSSNDAYAAILHFAFPESDYQDAIHVGYNWAEEYHGAEEDEAVGLACDECPS